MTEIATYLYALTRPNPLPQLCDIPGMAETPLRALAEGDVAAIVCDVPLCEFGEQPLQEKFENLAWLEKTARAHDHVVRLLAQQVTTAPLRLATIYRDDASVRGMLRAMTVIAGDVLTRLDGREEWGIKLYGRPDGAAVANTGATGTSAKDSGGSGADYLRRRRAALTSRQGAAQQAGQAAAQVFGQLSDLSADARAHRLQDPQLSGVAAPMLLNGAFLVDRGSIEDFSQLATQLADKHPQLRFSLTGPWPPYSFAALDDQP